MGRSVEPRSKDRAYRSKIRADTMLNIWNDITWTEQWATELEASLKMKSLPNGTQPRHPLTLVGKIKRAAKSTLREVESYWNNEN